MANGVEIRSYGRVFNEIADEYERHGPAYPDALIDRTCEVAGLAPGARVLEIGCGTGQLTRSLLARGLRVMVVEPGEQLIARARDQLAGAGEVQFVNARLEEASVPRGHYRAVFSASAIHRVDPDVSWRKIADALVDDGTVALVSYFGRRTRAVARISRLSAPRWLGSHPSSPLSGPSYRELDGTLQGATQRHENVSEAWTWLGRYEVARGYVADLFEDAQLAAMPILATPISRSRLRICVGLTAPRSSRPSTSGPAPMIPAGHRRAPRR